jgi:hypothetical protein
VQSYAGTVLDGAGGAHANIMATLLCRARSRTIWVRRLDLHSHSEAATVNEDPDLQCSKSRPGTPEVLSVRDRTVRRILLGYVTRGSAQRGTH